MASRFPSDLHLIHQSDSWGEMEMTASSTPMLNSLLASGIKQIGHGLAKVFPSTARRREGEKRFAFTWNNQQNTLHTLILVDPAG